MAQKVDPDVCECGHSVRDHGVMGQCTASDTRKPGVIVLKRCPCSLFTPKQVK